MTTNVLILCTHNSARSILAEAILNDQAARLGEAVRAFSAGSHPSWRVNPMALRVLEEAGIPTAGLRSKSWDEFTKPGAPGMRIVITVCDSAAQETCPVWPGSPVRVHWGYPDPSSAAGDEAVRHAAFVKTRQAISGRMQRLLRFPLETMSDDSLQAALSELSRAGDGP